jgi:hypothetical protein
MERVLAAARQADGAAQAWLEGEAMAVEDAANYAVAAT